MTEFIETFEKLKANVLEETNRKLRLNQLKRNEMESYIAKSQPIPKDIYSIMCFKQLPMAISRNNEII